MLYLTVTTSPGFVWDFSISNLLFLLKSNLEEYVSSLSFIIFSRVIKIIFMDDLLLLLEYVIVLEYERVCIIIKAILVKAHSNDYLR
jgi:hypothetical protein